MIAVSRTAQELRKVSDSFNCCYPDQGGNFTLHQWRFFNANYQRVYRD
jgi:hypothetical protein